MKGLKIYIAGKITGFDGYRERFAKAEQFLREQGAFPMHSAGLPQEGFSHSEYLYISFAMIDVCDAVYFLDNSAESEGAKKEFVYAAGKQKRLFYEDRMKSANPGRHFTDEEDYIDPEWGCI